MKKKVKTSQLTIADEERPNGLTHDSSMIYAFSEGKISPAFIDKWVEELYDYPKKNPTAKFMSDFYRAKGWKRSNYYYLVETYPAVKEAHEEVMSILGERMYNNAVENKWNWSAVKWGLHDYSPQFEKWDSHQATLNKQDPNAGTGNVIWVSHNWTPSEEGKKFMPEPKKIEEKK